MRATSKRPYEIDWTGLAPGKLHYTDRNYHITEVPNELVGLPFLRTSCGDDRSVAMNLASFVSDSEVKVYLGLDRRVPRPMSWMRVGQSGGFEATEITLKTTDPDFKFYRKTFPLVASKVNDTQGALVEVVR